MENNKGFTLIELLATIFLLGIIATISYVSISKIIEQSKVNNCKNLKESIISATNEYISDNRYNSSIFDDLEGNVIIIHGSDLLVGNYLTVPIKNPFDNRDIDLENNDISISVVLNKDYTTRDINITSPSFLFTCTE